MATRRTSRLRVREADRAHVRRASTSTAASPRRRVNARRRARRPARDVRDHAPLRRSRGQAHAPRLRVYGTTVTRRTAPVAAADARGQRDVERHHADTSDASSRRSSSPRSASRSTASSAATTVTQQAFALGADAGAEGAGADLAVARRSSTCSRSCRSTAATSSGPRREGPRQADPVRGHGARRLVGFVLVIDAVRDRAHQRHRRLSTAAAYDRFGTVAADRRPSSTRRRQWRAAPSADRRRARSTPRRLTRRLRRTAANASGRRRGAHARRRRLADLGGAARAGRRARRRARQARRRARRHASR